MFLLLRVALTWTPTALADHELDRGPATPGAVCSQAEEGHYGRTVTGILMTCRTTATDDRLPWRQAVSTGTFFDDDGNVHEGFIEAIAAQRVTRGCNPPHKDRYCPCDSVTLDQMAAFLVRALGLADADHPGFTDVMPGSTFDLDIRELAKAGVTEGCNPPANTQFCPNDFVTREQMAAFLVPGFEYADVDHPGFVDVAVGSTFAQDINRLATAGVTLGCNPPANSRYCPKDFVKRDQMASFMGRALELTPLQP